MKATWPTTIFQNEYRTSTALGLFALFLILFLPGCSPQKVVSPYVQFENAGIQVLSTTNPYHGPNMLLARTIEESPTLVGYFHHKGAPRAIEVRKATPLRDELLFYYPEDYRVYLAKRARKAFKRKPTTDWIIAGPYGIGKIDFRRINSFSSNFSKKFETPVFLIHGLVTRYKADHKIQRIAMLEPEIPLIPIPKKPKPKVKKKPKPKPEQVEAAKKPSHTLKAKVPNLNDPKFVPTNSDQEALMLSQGYAKRDSNGDILHDIEGNAQSLKNIAHWYMGSVKLVPDLQEANNIPELEMSVKKGRVLRIPQKFIKNTKKMPMSHRVKKAPPPPPVTPPASAPAEQEQL